jgi:hypothetical protein
MGVSAADIPLQGAGTASIPALGREPGHLAIGVGRRRLGKKALSGCARRKSKIAKAKESEAKTGGNQQPGHASTPKQETTSTKTPKRPRSEDNTPTETIGPLKRPRDSRCLTFVGVPF